MECTPLTHVHDGEGEHATSAARSLGLRVKVKSTWASLGLHHCRQPLQTQLCFLLSARDTFLVCYMVFEIFPSGGPTSDLLKLYLFEDECHHFSPYSVIKAKYSNMCPATRKSFSFYLRITSTGSFHFPLFLYRRLPGLLGTVLE